MQWRRATDGDVPALARMNAMLLEDEGHRRRPSIPDLEARMRGWLGGAYAAALFEESAAVVAYALWRTDEDGAIYVRQLWVARERRRQGLGRRAFEILRTEALPAGARIVLDVLVENARAIAFWKSLGFTDYATTLELRAASAEG